MKECSLEESERVSRKEASKTLFVTAIQSGFVYHLSVFLFEEVLLLYSWFRHHFQQSKEVKRVSKYHRLLNTGVDTAITLKVLVKKSLKNLVICVSAILAEGIGASLGTWVYPGYGTVVGSRLCSNAAYLL